MGGGPLALVGTLVGVVVLVIVAFAVLHVSFEFITTSRRISNHATIDVDDMLAVDRSDINWGTLTLNENKTEPLIITNTSPVSVTLTFVVHDWEPANVSDVVTVTWNYTADTPVASAAAVPVGVTLHVGLNAYATPFSFAITITATEHA